MHFKSLSVAALAYLLPVIRAQQVGTLTAEKHPSLSVQECTKSGCQTVSSSVVLDSNWRWLHEASGSSTTNCYDGNKWDTTLCPDDASCAQNCAIEGADYEANYGITTSGDSLTLSFVTEHQYGTNVGSRVYLMDGESKYKMLNLLNKEFTFDVDLSSLPCGLNGALYFVSMEADGGMSSQPNNKAGAKYGTGYCDAQCPHDIKFIGGEANVDGWNPSENDSNAGKGKYGTCCHELDIWEANSMGTAYTPHPCTKDGPYKCESDCGDGSDRYGSVCDKDGCDFNSYRMGDTSFYGKGKTVDSSKPMTVVTQFITEGNSPTGTLKEIRRLYVQNGKVINNSWSKFDGLAGGPYDSITEQFCESQKTLFGDNNQFKAKGGMKKMGEAMAKGMVLVMSIWDDYEAKMLWLDSAYPLDKDPAQPGVTRGECARTSGEPKEVEAAGANVKVKFSNIKWGEIGSTFTGTVPASVRPASSGSSASPAMSGGNCKAALQQCGGSSYTGATCCVAGTTCTMVSQWYSQCK